MCSVRWHWFTTYGFDGQDTLAQENVLIERNDFVAGHGVAIGSETSGWIRDVVLRDLTMRGVEAVVRIKSTRGVACNNSMLCLTHISTEQMWRVFCGFLQAQSSTV
jgi:polygalacturonase